MKKRIAALLLGVIMVLSASVAVGAAPVKQTVEPQAETCVWWAWSFYLKCTS